jgi:hypothetical protein
MSPFAEVLKGNYIEGLMESWEKGIKTFDQKLRRHMRRIWAGEMSSGAECPHGTLSGICPVCRGASMDCARGPALCVLATRKQTTCQAGHQDG